MTKGFPSSSPNQIVQPHWPFPHESRSSIFTINLPYSLGKKARTHINLTLFPQDPFERHNGWAT